MKRDVFLAAVLAPAAAASFGFTQAATQAPPVAAGASGADAFTPQAADLTAYAGRYASDEAETEFTIARDGSDLVLK